MSDEASNATPNSGPREMPRRRAAIPLALMIGSAAMGQTCQPFWVMPSPTLFQVEPSHKSLFVFDDGSGSKLYTAGYFYFGVPQWVATVGRWDGQTWSSLTAGIPQGYAPSGPWIRVLDDGSGPRLYAFGSYQNNPNPGTTYWISTWDGTSWHPAPDALYAPGATPRISANLGNGMAIYGLQAFGQGSTGAVAKWSGGSWSVLGGVANASIYELELYDDGTGPALYATGGFTNIGGVPLRGIAKWNGQQWSPVGSGIGIMVWDMAVYDDGRGSALYIVGAGNEAGGVTARNIARWDGQHWEGVGGGFTSCAGCPSAAYAAGVFDDGTGPGLYVAGYLGSAGSVPVHGIARWNGQQWSPLASGIDGSYADSMAVFNDGRGPSLFVTETSGVGGGLAPGIAQWVGCPSCYPNCDNSTRSPALNVADFTCFLQRFALHDAYANCNQDATIDVADFVCYITRFTAGCP
jgi:hypothetical protein